MAGFFSPFSGTPVCRAQIRPRTRRRALAKKRVDETFEMYRVPPAKFISLGWWGYNHTLHSLWLDRETALHCIATHLDEQSPNGLDGYSLTASRRRAACELMMYAAARMGRYATMMPILVGGPGTVGEGKSYRDRRRAAREFHGCTEEHLNGTIRPRVIDDMAQILYGVVNYPQDLEAFLASIRCTA